MNGNNDSVIRAIRGPVTLITIGVLFALNNFTRYSFEETWPVLLIVFGLLSLLRRSVEPAAPPPGPRPPYPQYPPQPPGPTFRQSQYPGTVPPGGAEPTVPAKGGFGSSAPPRTTETGPAPGETA